MAQSARALLRRGGARSAHNFSRVGARAFRRGLVRGHRRNSAGRGQLHFGLPPAPLVARIKVAGALILSSATTVAEARWLEQRGADVIIAQGREAAGIAACSYRTISTANRV